MARGLRLGVAAAPADVRLVGNRARCKPDVSSTERSLLMIGWAVTFLVIALIAAIFGFSGIAGTAVNIAWILAVIGIIIAIVFFVMGRRPPL
jgi:uncharacterized membrane protein YtjA (UPF0391 family)